MSHSAEVVARAFVDAINRQDVEGLTRLMTPAAWKAVVEGGLVAEWRVYANNEPIRERMRRAD